MTAMVPMQTAFFPMQTPRNENAGKKSPAPLNLMTSNVVLSNDHKQKSVRVSRGR